MSHDVMLVQAKFQPGLAEGSGAIGVALRWSQALSRKSL